MTIATTTRALRHRHWVRSIVVDFVDSPRRQRMRQGRRQSRGQCKRKSRRQRERQSRRQVRSRLWQVQHENADSFWFLLTKCSWWTQATPTEREMGEGAPVLSNCFILLIMHWAAYEINPQSVVAAPQWVVASISPRASSFSHWATFRFLLRCFLAEFQFQMSRNTSYLLTVELPASLNVRLYLSLSCSPSLPPSHLTCLEQRLVIKVCRQLVPHWLSQCVCVWVWGVVSI